jgi:hypothetical protein
MSTPHEPDLAAITALLRRWIGERLNAAAAAWATAAIDELAATPADARLYRLFGEVHARCGTADLSPTAADLAAADAARPGWDPRDWSIDQVVRLALLLATAGPAASVEDRRRFGERLDMLIRTADVRELVTLHLGWPLQPDAAAHAARAQLGCRSNIRPVFEAVAHRNPYPAEAFAEGPWNHMVLKALFVGSRLDPIVGLESRANPRLTAMLRQYAGERRAASRPVSPELWRCVGVAPDAGSLDDLLAVLRGGEEAERRAAVLALRRMGGEAARAARTLAPEIDGDAAAGAFGWPDL